MEGCFFSGLYRYEKPCDMAMTFGAKDEVLEPEEVRDIICRNAEEIIKIYGELGK